MSEAVEVYRVRPVMEAAELGGVLEAIDQAKRVAMRDGIDYGVIPNTGPKPTLLKPGAERLLLLFGLTHRMEITQRPAPDGSDFRVMAKCSAMRGDQVVAECVGVADYLESRFQYRSGRAPWNTLVKMAEKRALVGVALQATGSSGLFTQDMEDAPLDDGRPFTEATTRDGTP